MRIPSNIPAGNVITVQPVEVHSAPAPALAQTKRPSWRRMALALGVAAVSDALSFVFTLVLPVQWAIDFSTAFVLFLIFGKRRAILPGLVAEAVPGMGIFPVWILVVISIVLYDNIKGFDKIKLR